MFKKFFLSIGIVLTLFLFGKSVLAYQSPGEPTGYVNDFANILSSQAKTSLENTLKDFTQKTSSEISVVIVPSLKGDEIEPYATALYREWGIGTKTNNNGVLLLVSIEDKKIRIETGYGLEGALPDILAGSIIRNTISPLFKEGKYDEGITQGVNSIIKAVQNEYQIETKKTDPNPWMNLFPFLLFFFIFGWQILVAVLAPTKSWWLGGVIGGTIGAIVGAITTSIFWGVGAVFLFALLGFIIDYFLSKTYTPGKHPIDDFFSGGTRGGFGGDMWGGGESSGGWGGFSGGSSGGGGASGSW